MQLHQAHGAQLLQKPRNISRSHTAQGRQPRLRRERARLAMCILHANIGMNTFTAEEPGPQKANTSSALAHEINSALCIFPPKNVKKASLDILKAQSPAISSLHTHEASSAAHRDMIPATQKTGFCQVEGPSSQNCVWGDLLPSRISATHTPSLPV